MCFVISFCRPFISEYLSLCVPVQCTKVYRKIDVSDIDETAVMKTVDI